MRITRLVFLFVLLLAMNGCQMRYAYLQKVKAPVKRGTMRFTLENRSPELLGGDFEDELRAYCIRRIQAEGYRYTEQNPMYHLHLEMRIDSSLTKGMAYVGPGPGMMPYSRRSKGILFDLLVTQEKTGSSIWEDHYDLYYFDVYKRDLSRSKGVLRYMISEMNQPR